MLKEVFTKEVSDIKMPEQDGIKAIKPETNLSPQERDDFWKNDIFKEPDSDAKENNYFNAYDVRLGCTPKEDSDLGSYEGARGESKFTPNEETAEGKLAMEKLAEKGLDGIEYKNAEPDFATCAEISLEIDNMTENRGNYLESDGTSMFGNFAQADIKCAEKWNAEAKGGKTDWTARGVYDWRVENNHSWHERCDTKTMDLVPTEIHEKCRHLGGVSECKVRDSIDIGGEFDE